MRQEEIETTVYVRLPWATDEKAYFYAISREEGHDALRPLPRERELYGPAAMESARMHEKRKRIADLVSRMIANALMHSWESEDPENGYRRGNPRG